MTGDSRPRPTGVVDRLPGSAEALTLDGGYVVSALYDVKYNEVAGLMRRAGLIDDDDARNAEVAGMTPAEIARLRDFELMDHGVSIYYVGAKLGDELVGIAALYWRPGEGLGQLENLAVLPEHQGKGIGKTLLLASLGAAQEQGLESLYVSPLEPTNTLRTYYHDLGFEDLPNGGLGRGPNPVDIVTIGHQG